MAAVLNEESIPVGAGGVGNLLLVAPESPRRGPEQLPPKLGLEEIRSSVTSGFGVVGEEGLFCSDF